MKLHTEDVIPGDGRDEGATVRGLADDVSGIRTDEVVAVDEVEVLTGGNLAKQRGGAAVMHFVPADVRDPEARLGWRQPPHLGLDPPEALGLGTPFPAASGE